MGASKTSGVVQRPVEVAHGWDTLELRDGGGHDAARSRSWLPACLRASDDQPYRVLLGPFFAAGDVAQSLVERDELGAHRQRGRER
jgi:hypothetical protein